MYFFALFFIIGKSLIHCRIKYIFWFWTTFYLYRYFVSIIFKKTFLRFFFLISIYRKKKPIHPNVGLQQNQKNITRMYKMNSNHSNSSRRPFSRGAAPRNRQRLYSQNPHSHNDNYQQRNFGQWYKDPEPCYSHG